MRGFFGVSAIIVLGVIASGCCVDRVYRPSACNDGFDPVLGTCSGCNSCGGNCGGHTPGQVTRHNMTCGSGCGEIYWGEWISDPPDDCDPCDNCGNFVGPRCCPPSFWQQLFCCENGFWGGRYDSCGGCAEGCSSCMGDDHMVGHEFMEGEVIHSAPGTPHPAQPPQKQIAPQNQGVMPNRQQRPNVPQPMPAPPATDEPVTPMNELPMSDAPAGDMPEEMPAPNTQTRHHHMHRHAPGQPMLLRSASKQAAGRRPQAAGAYR